MPIEYNRSRIRSSVMKILTPHTRAWRIARKARTAYGKVFGWAHVLPNAYIIGFGKCGTTSLYSYLVEHEQIYKSASKEVHYFDMYSKYMQGHNWYRSNFPLTVQKIACERFKGKKFVSIDATPRYIMIPGALNRIKQATPNAKFIVMVRNPIDRAYSHYNANVKSDTFKMHDFGEEIERELQLEQSKRRMQTGKDAEASKEQDPWRDGITSYNMHRYARVGVYVRRLRHWLDEFPNQVLVIDLDLLATDMQSTLDLVTDFLGIARCKFTDTRRFNVGAYQSKMDPKTRARLAEYYRKPNAELYKLLGRDFGWDKD